MIEVTDLHKHFGPVVAVDGVTFTAPDGRVTGLLGPNGAGKTTTLRMIYGLLTPDAGRMHIDGTDVLGDITKAQQNIGVLPDARGLYQRLTAREHIHYFGKIRGMRGAELDRRTSELAELLDMGDILDRRAAGFSQGERMKVALARALIHQPQNMLLDEPTNGLDVMSTRAVRQLIRNLRAQGKCVLFSSHIMQEVSALCDDIVIIARGRIVAQGSPDDIRRQAQEQNLEDAFLALSEAAEEDA